MKILIYNPKNFIFLPKCYHLPAQGIVFISDCFACPRGETKEFYWNSICTFSDLGKIDSTSANDKGSKSFSPENLFLLMNQVIY